MIGTMTLYKKKLKENSGNKGEDTLKMIFIHMREVLQELQDGPSSPSTPSIMLSMRKKDLME